MKKKSLSVGCLSSYTLSVSSNFTRRISIRAFTILAIILAPSLTVNAQWNSQLSVNALSFDGINDYVSIGYVNYAFGTYDFSIEARIRDQAPAGGNSEEVVISSQSASATNGIRVEILNGHLTTFLGGNSYTCNSADLRDNTCHHIAITRQSGILKHYLDGVLLGPVFNSGDNVDSPDPILIGIKRVNGGLAGSFNGLLKEVRVWTGARSQFEIQFTMNSVPYADVDLELLGYWRFNEGSGQLINCCQGNVSPGGFLGASSSVEAADPIWTTGCPSCLPPNIYITSSTSSLCPGNTATLTANTDAGMTFQWAINGSAISGATSSTYLATVTGSYTVLVSGTCGSTNGGPFNLNAGTLPVATISTNSLTTFCSGGSALLNANAGNGLSYQWKRNGVAIAGATSTSYAASVSGVYTCTETNVCGSNTSNGITITVLLTPALPGLITGAASVCKKQTKTYSISPVGGASTYMWTVPSGAHLLSGQGTTSITVRFGNNGGNITVKAVNSCGISPVRTLAVVMNCRETDDAKTFQEVVIFPNPSSGHFTLQFDALLESIKLDVRDITGKQMEVIEYVQAGSEITIGESWPMGIYFVTITTASMSQTKKLVKRE